MKKLDLTDEEINRLIIDEGLEDSTEPLDFSQEEGEEELEDEEDSEDESEDDKLEEEFEASEEESDEDSIEDEEVEESDEVDEVDEFEELEQELTPEGVDFTELTGGLADTEDEVKEIFEVLKDPYFKGAFDYFKQTKTLAPYAMAKTFGSTEYWSQLSDEQVVIEQIKLENAGSELTPDQLDLLVEDELERYKLDEHEYEEKEIQKAKLKLKLRADKARKEFVAEYQKYAEPPREEKKPEKSPEQIEQERIAARKKIVSNLKQSITDNKINFNVGEDKVSLKVSPKALVEMGSDFRGILTSIVKNGQIDWEALAFLSNKDAYKAAIQNTARSKGKKEFVDTNLKNKQKSGKKDSKNPNGDYKGLPHPSKWKVIE